MTRARKWTDDDLREAIAASWSMLEVTNRLGLRQGGPTNQMVRRRADELGLVLRDGRDPRPPAVPSPLARVKRPTPSGVDGGREGG